MNYFEQNKRIIIGIIFIILTLLVIIFYGRESSYISSEEEITATVFPLEVTLGDTLWFKDSTDNVRRIEWDFGNSKKSISTEGFHIYSEPGFYRLRLRIDNQFTKIFPILVSKQGSEIMSIDLQNDMEAPSVALQKENIVFRAIAPIDIVDFTWNFGDNSGIGSKDRTAIYAYDKPGDYTVELFIGANSPPMTHSIKVLPSFDLEKVESINEVYDNTETEIKKLFQNISNGKDFNTNYNTLVRKYFCGDDNIRIDVNNEKKNLYYYATGLRFDRGNVIHKVDVTFDRKQKCVTKIEITQDKE